MGPHGSDTDDGTDSGRLGCPPSGFRPTFSAVVPLPPTQTPTPEIRRGTKGGRSTFPVPVDVCRHPRDRVSEEVSE